MLEGESKGMLQISGLVFPSQPDTTQKASQKFEKSKALVGRLKVNPEPYTP